MGRLLLKCAYCGAFFATGMNISTGVDPRRKNKFKGIPYRCSECGEEREYGSDDLVDEGNRVGSKAGSGGKASPPKVPPPPPSAVKAAPPRTAAPPSGAPRGVPAPTSQPRDPGAPPPRGAPPARGG